MSLRKIFDNNSLKFFKALIFSGLTLLVFFFGNRAFAQTSCTNSDFSLNNFNNWTGKTGSCCPINLPSTGIVAGRHTIMTGTGTDPNTGNQLKVVCPGYTHSARIGNSSTGSQAESLRYTINVTNNTSLFIYNYAVVLDDPISSHTALQTPRFEMDVKDQNNNPIPCTYYQVSAMNGIPGFRTQTVGSKTIRWKDWTTVGVNLQPYIGQNVTIELKTGDCSLGGHYGYAYVTAECRPLSISTIYCVGDSVARLTAPAGFRYLWSTNDTTQTITINNPTTNMLVTCQITSVTNCQATLSMNLVPTAVNVGFTITNLCPSTVAFVDTSKVANGVINYWRWKFGDGTIDSSQQHPTKSYAAGGNYNVELLVRNNHGCKDSATFQVPVHPRPIPGFTVNNLNQCNRGNNYVFTNTSTISNGTMTYRWLFGDGDSSTQTSPNKTYLAAGTYTVKLHVRSNNNCIDSFSRQITVYPNPVSGFNINNSSQCLAGNNFTFTNTSSISSGTMTYLWDLAGSSSTLTNTTRSFGSTGNYPIKLKVTSNFGCTDSIIRNVIVNPQPSAGFTVNDSIQCFKTQNYQFSNSSAISSGTLVYAWTFGDGGGSSQTHPQKTYSTEGLFQVKLKATSGDGCVDSTSRTVRIAPHPVSAFTLTDSIQCLSGNSFSFANNSTISSGTQTYNWKFGDGGSSSLANPVKNYSLPGNYQVLLTSLSNYGCRDSVARNAFVDPSPVTAFAVNDTSQCFIGNSFSFTNNSTVSQGSLGYEWNFGDGTSSTNFSPVKSYALAGIYQVKLRATSDKACKDSLTKTVYVRPMPVAGFNVNDTDQCLNGNSFTFDNTSSIATGAMNYLWTFGDLTTSVLASPVKSYNLFGNYDVKLKATSLFGCSDSLSRPVVVFQKPQAAFSFTSDSGQCFSGNSFSFASNSSVNPGTIVHSWYFGDGDSSNLLNPGKIYNQSGIYPVKLRVATENGCADSMIKNASVWPKPDPAYTVQDTALCVNGNNFVFSNGSTISSGTISYNWRFGDGNTSVQTNPNHTYVTPGNYEVKMIVTSDKLCRDSASQWISVLHKPVPGFNATDSAQCLSGNSFTFNNLSSIPSGTMFHNWTFGDGDTSSQQSPVKSYSTEGTYFVKLKVSSNSGCADSVIRSVTVHPKPSPMFSFNNTRQCSVGNNFVLTNSTTISSGTYTSLWDFGDGNQSVLTNPAHSYSNYGVYLVKLIATSDKNCRDSLVLADSALEMPVSAFSVNDTGQCLTGNSYLFLNNSTISQGNLSYEWLYGNGNSSTSETGINIYSNFGTYLVKLISTSDYGCRDTVSKSVTVYPQPVSGYSINNPGQCLNLNNYIFTNSSAIPSGTLTYNWNFGDGGSSILNSPNKVYLTEGTYPVKLTATSGFGCIDSITKTVDVYPMPVASYSVNDSDQCVNGNNFSFTNGSSIPWGSISYLWRFGDSTSSVLAEPSKLYAFDGIYPVNLTAISGNGCRDSVNLQMVVYPKPLVNFNVNDSGQCLVGNSFVFSNLSTIKSGTLTYDWKFGDATGSSFINPVKSYPVSNNYPVRLTALSSEGCSDSISKPVVVYYKPNPAFSVNDSDQCLTGNSFAFNNGSTLTAGTLNYNWRFGDGGTSSLVNPSKIYSGHGFYQVKMIAESEKGCKDSTQKIMEVFPMPNVKFGIGNAAQCLNGNNFQFTDSSTVASGTFLNAWKFGDLNSSPLKNPLHVYGEFGNYPVTNVVTTDKGCIDSLSKPVTVYPKPFPDFSINDSDQCVRNNLFAFNNKTSIAYGSMTYFWNFGDGKTSIAKDTANVYALSGAYPVKLRAVSDRGCADSLTKLMVAYPMPKSSFSVADTAQCLNSNVYTFNNKSTISAGTLSYDWTFGDGNGSASQNPAYTFSDSGTYVARLIASSGEGCHDTASRTLIVFTAPVPQFLINNDSQCVNGNNFVFTNTSSVKVGTMSYFWDFNDGNTSNFQNTLNTFAGPGTYAVKLIATSNLGCVDSITRNVTVHPLPDFDVTVDDVCLNFPSVFYSNYSIIKGGIKSWDWSFGDGTSSTDSVPKHVFKIPGLYNTGLTLTTDKNCRRTKFYPSLARVNELPEAAFNWKKIASGPKETTLFFADSSKNAVGWHWDFGNGLSGMQKQEIIQYSDTGTYCIREVVFNSLGCTDTARKCMFIAPDFYYYVPSAYTPDGNGLNDYFTGVGSAYLREFELFIFNRWGEKIFESHDPAVKWDGTYLGREIPPGTFLYMIRIVDLFEKSHFFNGTVYLLR